MEFETAVTIPWKTEEIRRRSWCGQSNFTLLASLTMRSVHPHRWTPQALRASLHTPDQDEDRAGPGTEESALLTPLTSTRAILGPGALVPALLLAGASPSRDPTGGKLRARRHGDRASTPTVV